MTSAPPKRRPRGTAAGCVPLFVEVAPDAKAVLDRAAAATGAAKWAVLEEILRHVPVDEHGRPQWWPIPHDQEALPLKTA